MNIFAQVVKYLDGTSLGTLTIVYVMYIANYKKNWTHFKIQEEHILKVEGCAYQLAPIVCGVWPTMRPREFVADKAAASIPHAWIT